MCVQALSLNSQAADAYVQLSRMTGTAEFDLSEDMPNNKFVSGRKRLSREDLLLIACQCDPRLPDVYYDLASLVPSYGTINVLGIEYDRKYLLRKADDLSNNIFDDDDIVDNATVTTTQESQKTSEASTWQQRRAVFAQVGKVKCNNNNSSMKMVDVSTPSRVISSAPKAISSRWTVGISPALFHPDAVNVPPSYKLTNVRKALGESYAFLRTSKSSSITAKKINEMFGDIVAAASSVNEPLPIYAAISLMEIDCTPFSGPIALVDEVTRCLTTKGSTIAYLQDAMECLTGQMIAYKSSADENFDVVYLLACSLLERKSGDFKKAKALLDTFSTRAQDDTVLLAQMSSIVEHEVQLHTVFAERSNTNSTAGKAKNNASQSRGSSSAAARQEQPRRPLVFKCVAEEWQYEKKKLSADEREKLTCMDKIMEFVGLEQVCTSSYF